MSDSTLHPTEAVDPRTPRERPDIAMYLFFAIGVVLGVDLALDVAHSTDAKHLLTDGAATILAAGGSVLGWRVWRKERKARIARAEVEEKRGQGWQDRVNRWQEEHTAVLSPLRSSIEAQLAAWGLDEDERNVARLLIAGQTAPQIARVLGVSLGTIEQLEGFVYTKSDLPGSIELRLMVLGPVLGLTSQLLRPPPAA